MNFDKNPWEKYKSREIIVKRHEFCQRFTETREFHQRFEEKARIWIKLRLLSQRAVVRTQNSLKDCGGNMNLSNDREKLTNFITCSGSKREVCQMIAVETRISFNDR